MSDHATTADGLAGPPHVHHMDSTTAYNAAKLGMWLFLATEILLFAVMFTCFALFRWAHLQEFHEGSHHLKWYLGGLNTLILLYSSYTAAVAVTRAQNNDNKGVIFNFGQSIACGGIFLIVKYFEYSEKYHHGFFPGGEHFHEFKNFLGLYFCMTGLHALHVIIGMGLMYWALRKAQHNRYSKHYYTPVEIGALYWHLVDLIWIFLFPLLYLVG